MNKQKTLRSLLLSMISLVMCVTMLVGSTFAWFTDNAVSGNNVITSGNLDIEVQYTLGDKTDAGEFVWNALDGATDLFQKGLWEPGHTEVVVLKVENKGSLALKYTANMNIVEEVNGKTKDGKDIVLSDVLNVSTLTQATNDVGEIALMLAYQGENRVAYETTSSFKTGNVLKADQELHPGDSHYVFVKVDMPTTVGNEANHDGKNAPSINFGINVLATQFTKESDSFGTDYDKDAEYLELPTAKVSKLNEKVTVSNFLMGSTDEPVELDTAYSFVQTEDAQSIETSPYRYWHADFVVTFDKDVAANAIGLAGRYESFSQEWFGLLYNDVIPANTPIRLLAMASSSAWTYEDICEIVNTFDCGAFLNDASAEGTTMKVELCLYEAEEGEKYVEDEGAAHVVSTVKYTFK